MCIKNVFNIILYNLNEKCGIGIPIGFIPINLVMELNLPDISS